MQKNIIALGLGLAILLPASSSHALSCLNVEMYLDSVLTDETTQVFIGTATEVKNHNQVVTVTDAVKGWVAPRMWVQHQYSDDWKYFCSNGPAKAGEPTLFFTSVDTFGSHAVTQTLPAQSDLAKDFIEKAEKAGLDAGITEATASDRASELMDSINQVFKALLNMVAELRYWQAQK